MNKLDTLKAQYNQKVSELVGLHSSDPKYKEISEELNPLDDEIKKLEAARDAELKLQDEKREAERQRVNKEEARRVKRWEVEIINQRSQEFEAQHGRSPRVNHCHSCKTYLLEFQESLCPQCGWMKCYRCGACEPECTFSLL